MDALKGISEIIYIIATIGAVDLLDKAGLLSKVFPPRLQFVGAVVILAALQAVPVFLPDLATIILATAILAGYIGYRIGHSRKGE